jgi:ankyrin repeat protein
VLAPPGDSLRQAASRGDLRELRSLLDAGADIDSRDTDGRTALMLATLNGRLDAVQLLLAHGADRAIADTRGVTPLAAAIGARQTAIAEALQMP